jgi:inosose dehydratase
MTGAAPLITVANAPVSYGAFELTVGIDASTPDGLHVLDEVTGAGYAGIDLGPVGYLGSGTELAERLAGRGLGLAGAYLELPYSDPDALTAVLPELDALLDTFDSVAGRLPGPAPHPTIADAGSPARRANPGRSHTDPSLGLDADGWRRFAAGLSTVLRRCRDRGYEPTFHNETGTYVEAPWEIERVLEVSDALLCLDTGHFLIGGGDPVAAVQQWSSRINQVHIKDAHLSVMADLVAAGDPVEAVWSRETFPRIGEGDLDVDGFLAALESSGFQGWAVVEQDTLPRTPERFAQAASDQRANREFLRLRGL